jgi:hypothetical protein
MMSQILFSVTCAMFAATACGGGQPPTAPAALTELSAAPTSIVVAGTRLALSTSLWRDFQPISPPDGKPLVAGLQMRTDDGSPVPGSVRADMVWVVYEGEAWSRVPQEERTRMETAPVYEVVARDGPKWGPNVTVDVIVRLVDGSGRTFLLRAASQPIRATW